jgi:heme/copper-type cytochrome/quinol oxidase subunit 2
VVLSVVLLAQHGQQDGSRGGDSVAFSLMALIGMIIPIIVLGVVCWFFWKAKQREDEEKRRREWTNAHSS